MTNLMIVESPTKSKKIQSYLGDGWIVKPSMGHIRDLPPAEMGVNLESFKPTYVPNSKGKNTISNLKKLLPLIDKVYLATDPDREGEAIAWHLQQSLNLKSPIRITFNTISKKCVQEAINKPGTIDINLVRAQEARRVVDRLVGYTVSPALSDAYGQDKWITAGRVQTIALRLVSDLEKRLLSFQPISYIEVYLSFLTDDIQWKAQWIPGELLNEGQKYWTDQAFAEQVANITDVDIVSINVAQRSRKPPAPFTTSDLLQAASVALKMNLNQCMKTAQSLSEQGWITYHRTDSRNLSQDGFNDVINWLSKNDYGNHAVNVPNIWKEDASAQEGHEAIRPDSINQVPDSIKQQLSVDEYNLYKLIWLRTVASQMKDAKFETTLLTLKSTDPLNKQYMNFIAKGEVIKYKGWKLITNLDATNEYANESTQLLPDLQKTQHLITHDADVKSKKTKSPTRFTQASLVKKLESEGIGRPATYASIITNIIDRNYVSIKKNKLYAEELGITIVSILSDKFKFMEFEYTRNIEKKFDLITNAKDTYISVVSDVYNTLKNEMVSLKSLKIGNHKTHSCPNCSNNLRLIKNKFWGCSAHPTCTYTAPNINNEPGENKSPKNKTIDKTHPCSCTNGFMQIRNPKNNSFWGCSNYPKCKNTLPNDNGQPGSNSVVKKVGAGKSCPSCKDGQVTLNAIKSGKNTGKQYLGCSNHFKKDIKCEYFSWAS